jgi:sigma-E factor negative regulatory protein RseB
MPGRHAAIVLLLFSLPAPGAEPASNEAVELLNRMSQATRDADYIGTFIYRHGRHTDSMRIIHRGGAAEQERLISLNGTPREVIRNGATITCIYPESQAVMVENSRPRRYVVQLPEPAERLDAAYSIALAGEDRVAGRATWIVDIRSRDAYRYGYRISIDKETHLPMRTELRAPSGASLEEVMFTQIELPAGIADADLEPGFSGQGYTWYHETAAADQPPAGPMRWQATWMPQGFEVSHHERRALANTGNIVHHISYSDGMSSVSVFVEPVPEGAPQIGSRRIGGFNTYVRLVRGHQVTAVGEVPPATVQRIANSVVSR